MKVVILLMVGAVLGAGAATAVHQSHIVQTNEQWLIVPRANVNLKDVYADVRHWSLEDWRTHPELARDMVKAGHAEIIQSDQRVTEEPAVDRISQRTDEHRTPHRTAEIYDDEPAESPRQRQERPLRRHDDFEPDSRPE